MKIVKILGGFLVLSALLIVLSVYWVANNLNSLVKDIIEQVGSDTLKTEVRVADVNIDLQASKVSLSGLTIANVDGFSAPLLFEMNQVAVDLEPASLLEKTIEVKSVLIDGTKVVAEQKGTTTNLQALLDNMPKSQSEPASQPAEPAATESSADPVDVLIKVGAFDFTNTSTQLITEQFGEREVNSPNIRLRDIGGDKGVPPDQLAQAVMQPLIKQVSKAVENYLKGLVEDKAKEKLKEKEDELKAKMDDKYGEGTSDQLKKLFGK